MLPCSYGAEPAANDSVGITVTLHLIAKRGNSEPVQQSPLIKLPSKPGWSGSEIRDRCLSRAIVPVFRCAATPLDRAPFGAVTPPAARSLSSAALRADPLARRPRIKSGAGSPPPGEVGKFRHRSRDFPLDIGPSFRYQSASNLAHRKDVSR